MKVPVRIFLMSFSFQTLLLFGSGFSILNAQDQFSPFYGSISYNSGITTICDFRANNNSIALAHQFGITTYKYLSKQSFLELGIILAKKGLHEVEFITYGPSSSGQVHHYINFFSFDFPITYNRKVDLFSWSEIYYSIGIVNAYIPFTPEAYTDGIYFSDSDAYRRYIFGISSGAGFPVNKFRISVKTNISLLPLIKKEFRKIFSETISYYNSILFPVEIIAGVSYDF